jgi:alkylation response protein AidB-like acyl-CoA dehydrogenase
MDFTLTEERSMLRDMLGRFLAENYDHETRQKLLQAGKTHNAEVFASLAELGVLGALFTEAQGGFGGAGFDIAVVFEELGRAGVIEPVLGNAALAGHMLASLGNATQQELLGEVIAGGLVLGFAHGEAGSRYDLSHVEASARLSGDAGREEITLEGVKTHVVNGAAAQLFVVSARESGSTWDAEGISLFLVPADRLGVSVAAQGNIDGTSGATVTLENVQLDASHRLGVAGQGYSAVEAAVAQATLAICAEALGAMEAAKTLTVDYLKERKQFGLPIGKFQALQHRMADMLIEIEQARSAVVNLAGALDKPRLIREREVSATKNLIGRVGALVAEECIQMHGGIGMTGEYALSHYARRLTMIDHQFGDVDHHLERFIALKSA